MVPAWLDILTRRMLAPVALRFRSPRSKDLEIIVLRRELAILRVIRLVRGPIPGVRVRRMQA